MNPLDSKNPKVRKRAKKILEQVGGHWPDNEPGKKNGRVGRKRNKEGRMEGREGIVR